MVSTAVLVFVLHLLYFLQPSSALPQGRLTDEKMRLGSTPPSCYNRCRDCHPCMAVQVPTTPIQQPGMGRVPPPIKEDEDEESFPTTISTKYTNYKPLGWKCRCGNHLFNP
ncbi:hypothetical protein ACHQM5_023541 [Ranunculus cassubicifolius]